jgi:hypothetical protein
MCVSLVANAIVRILFAAIKLRCLVHLQINLGTGPALAYSALSSSSPGAISLPANLFGSGIAEYVLQAAFKVSENVVDVLQAHSRVTT